MSGAVASLSTSAPQSANIFTSSRLNLYGYGLAIIYAAALIHFYLAGAWIVDGSGAPLYGDFTDAWVAGWHARNADASQLYDPSEFVKSERVTKITLHKANEI